jgi:TPR repeat protein
MTKRPDLMQRLMLLRHDPELVAELRAEAMKGDTDAQYGLGIVYAEGRGVEQDEIEAYAWLCVAMLQGDPEAENLRDVVMHSLSPEQTHEAAERAGCYVAQIEQHPAYH